MVNIESVGLMVDVLFVCYWVFGMDCVKDVV